MEHLSSMYKAMGLIQKKEKREERGENLKELYSDLGIQENYNFSLNRFIELKISYSYKNCVPSNRLSWQRTQEQISVIST